jgi:hypothetical protein
MIDNTPDPPPKAKPIKKDDQKKIAPIRSVVFRSACTLHRATTRKGICKGPKPLWTKCPIALLNEYVRGIRMLLMKYGPATEHTDSNRNPK